MSDQGEKTCPLCAEEMDLTDQQLKPCKCGYEICVWCWHYVMDMAEKDRTEGRCPACRTPYDKAKIEGMAAKCERLVSEVNMEKKKTQKAKAKPSDGRKQLSSVRVIQRNLVYIVGLPLNLADEDLLQRKEYFGQYGKVLKVSMSRTASGVIQQFPNNTCSVYITYSKEEEAIRCIQSVHGFTLDSRCLKACFGTTKYCHAWLRGVPCTNPDCLYLHEVGPQEDSFTKDEIISAYTRSRVQQITGVTNSLQRRSGNVLPPPLDEYCNTTSAKPIVKNASNNTSSIPKNSPPNGSTNKPALPAAASWASRALNPQSLSNLAVNSNGPAKQKPAAVNGILPFSSAVANTTHVPVSHSVVSKRSSWEQDGQTVHTKSNLDPLKHPKQSNPSVSQIVASGRPALLDKDITNRHLSVSSSSVHDYRADMQSDTTNSLDYSEESFGYVHMKEDSTDVDEKMGKLCANVSSMSVDTKGRDEHSGITGRSCSSDHVRVASPGNGGSHQQFTESFQDLSYGQEASKVVAPVDGVCFPRAEIDQGNGLQRVETTATAEVNDLQSFDCQELEDHEVENTAIKLPNSASFTHTSWYSDFKGRVNSGSYSLSLDNRNHDKFLQPNAEKSIVESTSSSASTDRSLLFPGEGNSLGDNNGNDIITNILSLDFDPWEESLSSPHNLARIPGETNQRNDPLKLSNARKVHSSNQSRFAFARQEEPSDPQYDANPYGITRQFPNHHHGSATSTAQCLNKFGISNGLSSNYSETFDTGANSLTGFSCNKVSGVSRTQISAPPGFSVPSISPPPGFSINERKDQSIDAFSGSHLLENPSLSRNSHHAPPGMTVGGSGDIEFMDPAILAVGRGRLQGGLDNAGFDVRSSLAQQINAIENEARLQLWLQQSFSGQQSLRFPHTAENLSSLFGSYGISSRLMNQAPGNLVSSPFTQISRQQSTNSLMSNGHWDGWNEVLQGGNGARMAELLRDERRGHNNFFTGYEDSKFQMPGSGDLYSRMYRM